MQDLARLPAGELSKEHVLSYHHSRLTHWKDALDSISTAVDKKADSVWSGQMVLYLPFSCLLLLLAALVNDATPAQKTLLNGAPEICMATRPRVEKGFRAGHPPYAGHQPSGLPLALSIDTI